ncbi:MAG: hypothetical protein IJB55_06630 [Firmicutes bacterium]|nr:hypothetical protein [Bacillota bacterium]
MLTKIGKKRVAVLAVLVLLIGVVIWALLPGKPDGRTTESREQILRELPKGIDWHIASEVMIGEYIISSVYANRYDGIAVFVPQEGGRYDYQTIYHRDKGQIVLGNSVLIDGRWYLLSWLNRADLDYAEVTFTVDGEAPETQRLDTGDSGLELICVEAPDADSYTASVVYYDNAGNMIE